MATNFTETTEHIAAPNQHEDIMPDVDVLDDRYRVTSLLAESSYAAIYEVVDHDYRVFAMKVQKVREDIQELAKEFAIYGKLLLRSRSSIPVTGIPWVYEYTKHNELEYLVMERLGESLENIANKFDQRQLNKKDVLMIGIQAVRRLEHLHKNGILHRDIKPENLLMGIGPNTEKTVHLLDFGTAITVEDWDEYNYERTVPFVGTEYFAAAEALFHEAPTRRGDMESLCYTLTCLAYGDLPWIIWDLDTGRKLPDNEMACQRVACAPKRLCEGFPALEEFVETVLQMSRTDEPDYEYLICVLEDGLCAEGQTNDGDFEWLPCQTANASTNSKEQEANRASQEGQQKGSNDCSKEKPNSTVVYRNDLLDNRSRDTSDMVASLFDHDTPSSEEDFPSGKRDAPQKQGENQQKLESSSLQLEDFSRKPYEFFIMNEVFGRSSHQSWKIRQRQEAIACSDRGETSKRDTANLFESLSVTDLEESGREDASSSDMNELSNGGQNTIGNVRFRGPPNQDSCISQENKSQESMDQDSCVQCTKSDNECELPRNDNERSALNTHDLFLRTLSAAGYLYSLHLRNHDNNGKRPQYRNDKNVSEKLSLEEIEKQTSNPLYNKRSLTEGQGARTEQLSEQSKNLTCVGTRRDDDNRGSQKRQIPVRLLNVPASKQSATVGEPCGTRKPKPKESGSERTGKRAYLKRAVSKGIRRLFSCVL